MDLLTTAIILFLVGVGLGAAEIFIPSAGVLVILSVASFIGSIVCAFKVSALWGFGMIIAAPVVMGFVVYKGFNALPRTRIGRRMILSSEQDNPGSSAPPVPQEQAERPEPGAELIGQEGVARTELRPSGSAQIGDQRFNVVSAGDYIAKGARVRIIEVHGNRIEVEEIT